MRESQEFDKIYREQMEDSGLDFDFGEGAGLMIKKRNEKDLPIYGSCSSKYTH